jgi:hypothetical protein
MVIASFYTIARWCAPVRSPANLRNACLQSADLRGASLVDAKLTGAFYDTETRWPRGFDPRRHRAKWVSQGVRRSGPVKDEHEQEHGPERLNA